MEQRHDTLQIYGLDTLTCKGCKIDVANYLQISLSRIHILQLLPLAPAAARIVHEKGTKY